jgi:hypothetical protein
MLAFVVAIIYIRRPRNELRSNGKMKLSKMTAERIRPMLKEQKIVTKQSRQFPM